MINIKTYESFITRKFASIDRKGNTFICTAMNGNVNEYQVLYVGEYHFWDTKLFYIMKENNNIYFLASDLLLEPFYFDLVLQTGSYKKLENIKKEFYKNYKPGKSFDDVIDEIDWIKLDQSKPIEKELKVIIDSKELGLL